jgi:hypothetical protein
MELPVAKSLFIFSFRGKKHLSYSFKLVIFLILSIEICLGIGYKLDLFRGGPAVTWDCLSKINKLESGTTIDCVILGDSRAVDIGKDQKDSRILNCATNWWTSMAGQFFLLEKIYNKGVRIKSCVLVIGENSWLNNMRRKKDVWKANRYFFKPLGSWRNTSDLFFKAKRPDLAWQMFINSLFPSLRFKDGIRELLERVYIRSLSDSDEFREKIMSISKEENIQNTIRKEVLKMPPLSRYYFERMGELCKNNDTKILVVEPYISESKNKAETDHEENVRHLTRMISKQGDVVSAYIVRRFVYPDNSFKRDGQHLSDQSLEKENFLRGIYKIIKLHIAETGNKSDEN